MKWTNTATGKTIEIYNEDCMPALKKMKENEFELAIVDPEFGIGIGNSPRLVTDKGLKAKAWDNKPIDMSYFKMLFLSSKNQIIWGGNYYDIGKTKHCIIWDKLQPEDLSFGMFDFAWTSFEMPNKMFRQSVQKEQNKIHPTQKPVALYKWLLKNYAKENDRILDTHLGSGSIAIACWDMGFDLVGYELDKDYFEATCKRLNDHFNQQTLGF